MLNEEEADVETVKDLADKNKKIMSPSTDIWIH